LENITATRAIQLMRLLKTKQDAYFSIIHYTYNQRNKQSNGLRKVDKCRLRAALKEDVFNYNTDLYLAYTDLDIEMPRMCFKTLIRYVAFPPDYNWLRVIWAEETEIYE
jgi:ribosomal protein L20